MKVQRKLDHQKLIGQKSRDFQSSFTISDSIFYALSVGFSEDPFDAKSLEFTYQNQENFKISPTYATVLHKVDVIEALHSIKQLPSYFKKQKIMHGEMRTQLFKTLKPNLRYVSRGQVKNVQDKGKFALVTFQLNTYEKLENGREQLAIVNEYQPVYMGGGGFGYSGTKKAKNLPKQPERKSDYSINAKSFANQAFFYRLNNDPNPMHIIPKQAEKLGLKIPILHGLCTEGIVVRAIIQQVLNNQVKRFKAIQVRFMGFVLAGQSYSIEVWKEEGYLYFKATVKQRNSLCLIGIIQLTESPKM